MKWLSSLFYRLCTTCRPNTSATVRFAFPVIFTMAVFAAAAVVSDSESYVRLQASTSNVEEGRTFSVDVFAFAHTPVNAIDITLSFPEDQVEVMGVDTGASVITLWTQEPYVSGNKVVLSGGTYRRGFVGEHLIATIKMRGKATGLAQFTTSNPRFLAGDGSGSEVAVNETKESVSLYIFNDENPLGSIGAQANLEIITDVDGDGSVTLKDVSMFMAAWFSGKSIRYDFNNDGKVTFKDFSIILADSFFR